MDKHPFKITGRYDSTPEILRDLREQGYPDSVRNEAERESYDQFVAGVKEQKRWDSLSFWEKTREVASSEWPLVKKSLWYFFLAFCIGYTIMHIFHISGMTSGAIDGNPYESLGGMGH